MRNIIFLVWFSYLLSSLAHADPTEAEMEAWFNDDAEQRAIEVNEGQLHFLPRDDTFRLHKGMNQVRLLPTSMADGWVELLQCHQQLDAVPLAEIVYPAYVLRRLKVTHATAIDKVSVQGATVQLEGVQANAKLCVRMEIQALQKHGNDYVLKNGPFQRRFLDGYYPMHVSLEVEYADSGLMPTRISPVEQVGVEYKDNGKQLRIDAVFEGVLTTRIEFRQR